MWLRAALWRVGEVEGAAELNCKGGRSRTEALYLHDPELLPHIELMV